MNATALRLSSAALHVERSDAVTFRGAHTLIDRMADTIREQVGSSGACTTDDLAVAGFTSAEIIEYADIARARARKALSRSVGK